LARLLEKNKADTMTSFKYSQKMFRYINALETALTKFWMLTITFLL